LVKVGDSTDLRSRLDEIAEALPTRAAMLSRLFLAQSSVRVSRTEAGVLQALAGAPLGLPILPLARA
jgi:hypothetical protein